MLPDTNNKCELAIALKSNIEKTFLMLGKELAEIRDLGLWQKQYTSFDEFLVDLKMSESTVSKLINLYKTFIVKFGFSEEKVLLAGGWSTLAEVLPHVDTKEEAEDFLHKATVLTRDDLRKEITEFKKGISQLTCNHDFFEVAHNQCRKCNLRTKIYLDDSQKGIIHEKES